MFTSQPLFAMGIPYDSEKAVEFGGELMEIIDEESHLASGRLAEERGCFPNWKGSKWEESGVPMRNATTTSIAPTGTISTMVGTTSGIEPCYGLGYTRTILGGQKFVESDPVFENVARRRGFFSPALMKEIAEQGSVQGVSHIPADVRRVFKTAHEIAPKWHVEMQAAFQNFCDAGISKTINLPASASVDDVREVFLKAYQLGCKGITVYRNGSRQNQPMSVSKKQAEATKANATSGHAVPMDLPEIMTAVRVKQATPFGNMHIKIVVDPKTGCEREIFAQLGKGGDLACADLEGMCRIASLFLRLNGALEEVAKQLDSIGTSLSISTKDGRIASLADGLAKALQKYLQAKKVAGLESLLLGKTDLSTIARGLRTLPDARDSRPATDEQVVLFGRLFKGRTDVYGTYDPVTKRAWQVKAPVRDRVLLEHLQGRRPYGVYLLQGDAIAAGAVDFDQEDTQLPREFVRRMAAVGIPVYIERSKSKGYHVWVFAVQGGVKARLFRSLAQAVLREMGLPSIEIFPKQDAIASPNFFGNFINAPLFGTLVERGRSVFVDESFTPYPDQWGFLAGIRRVSGSDLDLACAKMGCLITSSGPRVGGVGTPPKTAPASLSLMPCAQRMLIEGVAENQRAACFRLAVQLRKAGLPYEYAILVLTKWAEKNHPPEGKAIISPGEVRGQVRGAYGDRMYLSCGCDDPAISPFCSPSTCPIGIKRTGHMERGGAE